MCRKWFNPVLYLLSGMLTLAACDARFTPESHTVRFSAHSDGVATRTAYGDYDGNYIAIEWTSGDRIRIYSPEGGNITSAWSESGFCYADYILDGITTTGHISEASALQPAGEHGLLWKDDGEGETSFYSVYPASLGVASSGSGIGVTFSIPETQDGGDDISSLPLVAQSPSVSHGETVNMVFHPAFSAARFTIKSEMDDVLTLNSVTLSTEDTEAFVTGTGTYDLTTGEFSCAGAQHKSATVTFNPKRTITKSEETTFTIFTLPMDMEQMTITVNFTKDGLTGQKSLAIKYSNDDPITFKAGKMTRIIGLALPGGISFFLEGSPIVSPLDELTHEIDY